MASLGPLAIAALGLLVERPMHPYEMYQLLVDREEDRVLKVRPGTLYHAVDRLTRDGLVRPLRTERAGNRPERTTFEITGAGRQALTRQLVAMLSAPAEEYPEFALAISEAHNLSREQVLGCLRARIQALGDEQRLIADLMQRHDAPSVPRLYWLNVDYDRAMRAAEIGWLTRVVDELESGTLPWRESGEVRGYAEARREAGSDPETGSAQDGEHRQGAVTAATADPAPV